MTRVAPSTFHGPSTFPDTPAPVTVPALLSLPGYTIIKELARGGAGIVYEAIEAAFRREVAIKTLFPGRPFDADTIGRFDTEAHITARLQHPGIPPVFSAGRFQDGRPYMIMKRIRGRDLSTLLKERPSPAHGLTRVIAAFEQVCQAVGFAHSRGIVHRDLKPANITVGEFGEVQVMNWGLAQEARNEGPQSGTSDSSVPRSALHTPRPEETPVGRVLGAPAYMAPEQARGDWSRIGPWTDVFALGAILVDILTGQPPFVADGPRAVLALAGTGAVSDCFARLDACGADPALLALAKRCLAPEPQHRPADAKALADAVVMYRAGVEARLQKTETERVAAVAREHEARFRASSAMSAKQAAEARAAEAGRRAQAAEAHVEGPQKSRGVRLGLAVAVVVLLVGGAVFVWWHFARPF